jgi:HD domain-containing protein/MASE9 protein
MTDTSTKLFVTLVTIAAVISAAILFAISPGFDGDSIRAAAFFALVGLVAHSLAYQLAHSASGTVAHLPFLSAVLVAPGVSTVVAISATVLVCEILVKRAPIKRLFNVAQISLGASSAALVFLGFGGHPLLLARTLSSPSFRDSMGAWSIGPLVLAFVVYFTTNTCLVSGVVAVSQRRRFAAVWQQNTLNTLVYDALSLPAVFFFAFVYVRFGAAWALGLTAPILGLRQLYKTNWQLEKINEELLQIMVAAIEARDPYTSGHSQRVAEYARIVAYAAGVSTRATERIYTAAMLHDVGKIHEEFAPILRKPGRLTDSEFAVMKSHSEKGAALVGKVSQFRDLIPAILGHHEAWDGRGYPQGLRTEQIPLWARVIALADTIDAMTTDRPYRQALHVQTVRDEIRAQAGRQFDPRIAQELASERHWPAMEAAIGSNGASRKARPYISAVHVPHHSAEVNVVPA